jgi:hypothetical protein
MNKSQSKNSTKDVRDQQLKSSILDKITNGDINKLKKLLESSHYDLNTILTADNQNVLFSAAFTEDDSR